MGFLDPDLVPDGGWGRVVHLARPDPTELFEAQIFGKYLTVRKILSATLKRGKTVPFPPPQRIQEIMGAPLIHCPTTDREGVRHARGGVV